MQILKLQSILVIQLEKWREEERRREEEASAALIRHLQTEVDEETLALRQRQEEVAARDEKLARKLARNLAEFTQEVRCWFFVVAKIKT